MPAASLTSLAVILLIALGARLLLGLVPRLPLPGVVVEIVGGIVVGPAALGWAHADEPVTLLAALGVAFLLFLAGLELDVASLRGPVMRLAGRGFVLSVALALAVGGLLGVAGVTKNPLLIAVTLTAASLGLVVPVLGETGSGATTMGRLVLASASLGDFGAIIALSLLFSRDSRSGAARIVLLGAFAGAVVVIAWAAQRSTQSTRLSQALLRLQDTSAQVRVRAVMALLVGLVVLAEHTGLETILAAFVAGALVGTIDRDTMRTHPQLRVKLDAIGHGFLVPVFFVASGVRFDLGALGHAAVLARVPVFLAALVVVRGVPALLYRSTLPAASSWWPDCCKRRRSPSW